MSDVHSVGACGPLRASASGSVTRPKPVGKVRLVPSLHDLEL
jgi:hypothetical protein